MKRRWYRLLSKVRAAWYRATSRCPFHEFFAIVNDDGYLYHQCLMCRERKHLTMDAPSPLRYQDTP